MGAGARLEPTEKEFYVRVPSDDELIRLIDGSATAPNFANGTG